MCLYLGIIKDKCNFNDTQSPLYINILSGVTIWSAKNFFQIPTTQAKCLDVIAQF